MKRGFLGITSSHTRVKGEEGHVITTAIHRYVPVFHTTKGRYKGFEQGFSSLPTGVVSGYYDYLYIYRSRCETNLSLNWGTR